MKFHLFLLFLKDHRSDGGERLGDRRRGGGVPRHLPPQGAPTTAGCDPRADRGGRVAGEDPRPHANGDEGHVPSGFFLHVFL